MKATVIDTKDNVAVVLGEVKKGEVITWVKDIPKGQPVVKYGEHIGLAAEDIQVGCHVHVHNVLNNRENL